MSSGCFSWCSLLMPWKFKVTETKTEVSNDSRASVQTSWLFFNCVRICLKIMMNYRSSRQRMSVPWWRTELWRQILGQRWEVWFLSCHLSLTHISIKELQVPEIELVAIASTSKECTSVPMEDRVLQTLQTNSKAAVRGMIHILSSLWHAHIFVQELPENHELAILSTTNECTLVEDRVVETNSRAVVRGLILYPVISLWHTSPSRNCLKLN